MPRRSGALGHAAFRTTAAGRVRFSITSHAVARFRQRVSPELSSGEAHRVLQHMTTNGNVRPTPRHWMRGRVRHTPGLRYVYWAALPDVCILVVGLVAVTVVTRPMHRGPRHMSRHPQPAQSWQVSGDFLIDELEVVA